MPPKNRTSWAMKTHMPRREESFWLARLSKWCRRAGWCAGAALSLALDNAGFLLGAVLVGPVGDDRLHEEVLGGRRRVRLPLQPAHVPRIRARAAPVAHRPGQVD